MQQTIQIRISVKTDQFLLFQRLLAVNIHVFQVYSTEKYIYFSIRKKDLSAFRKVRRKLKLKVMMIDQKAKGIIDIRSITIVGVLLFLCIPVILAQFIWSIQIDTSSPETNILLLEELKEMDIRQNIQSRKLPSEQIIRQKLLTEYKEYSWVHFTRSGSKLIVSPMLAPVQEDTVIKDLPPTNLIAKRSGVITDFELVKGERAVQKNVSVEKGDRLVNGFVTQGKKQILTSAEGKVFASYWIELEFELPKELQLTQPSKKELIVQQKTEKKPVFWKGIVLPKLISTYLEAGYIQREEEKTVILNEQSVETLVLPLLYQKIVNNLPTDTQILEDKVLHVSIESDKVKGKILLLINENIAIPQVIPQGDES